MAEAEVGDDGYGEDPTVNELEAAFAERVGMAAAVYVPSGIMANQVAVRVLAPPGHHRPGRSPPAPRRLRGRCGRDNSQVQLAPVDDDDGLLDPADVPLGPRGRLAPPPDTGDGGHREHPHGRGRARLVAPRRSRRCVAASGDLPVYVDGARIFNAEVATGIARRPPRRRGDGDDGVSVQGAVRPGRIGPRRVGRGRSRRPGSSVTGSVASMRQAGVIAAAGLVALRSMVERLAEDHRRARRLAEAVAERWPGSGLDPRSGAGPTCVIFEHRRRRGTARAPGRRPACWRAPIAPGIGAA